ncbi:transcription elongation factor, mitochondrial [Polyodon spathula]|nr:transcription elongation factor, mitochondrial [Polyodon spathula]
MYCLTRALDLCCRGRVMKAMWVSKHLWTVIKKGRHGLFRSPLVCPPELQHRFLHCTCCRTSHIASADIDLLNPSQPCLDSKHDKPLDACYTPEQRAVILRVLNTASESELASVKMLRGRKSSNIIEYRTRNGPFKDLHSVMNVPLLKHKTTAVVFNSILNPADRSERRKPKVQAVKFIKPQMERNRLEEASSVVSVVFGTNRIAWAHLERGRRVLEWQQEQCDRFLRGPYQASVYLEDISPVVAKIPEADFFILEKPGISLQNTNLFPIMLHLRTVEAMLYSLLGVRYQQDGQQRVLSMARTAVGKHFELMVGESRTSGAELVRQLLSDSVTQKHPRVAFPQSMVVRYRNMFQLGARNHREEMCDALLQALAFYELLAGD